MKIVVAGTGFSSILCINYLVNLGLKPVVLDVGNEIGEEEKIQQPFHNDPVGSRQT